MYGYYPQDPDLSWRVDSNLDANKDLQAKYWDMQEARGDLQQKLKQEYIEKYLPEYFRILQKRLLENSSQKHIVEDKMTIADFDNAHIAYTYVLNRTNQFHAEQRDKLKDYGQLEEYYESLHRELKDHFDKRPRNKPY